MKQVTVNVYTYNELPASVREKVKERYYEMVHSNEEFDVILRDEWESYFGNTKMPEIQYDFIGSQGSGVNLYIKEFDVLGYGEYMYHKTGLDFYREAGKIIEDYGVITLSYNTYCTHSLLDRDLTSNLSTLLEEIPDNSKTIIKNFVMTLFNNLRDFEKHVQKCGISYFYDGTDELYSNWLKGLYFLEDGVDFNPSYELS